MTARCSEAPVCRFNDAGSSPYTEVRKKFRRRTGRPSCEPSRGESAAGDKTAGNAEFMPEIVVSLENVDTFTMRDLSGRQRKALWRRVMAEWHLGPGECPSLNGGVITTEGCCTNPRCRGDHTSPSCEISIGAQQRLALWRRALGDRTTGEVRVRPRSG